MVMMPLACGTGANRGGVEEDGTAEEHPRPTTTLPESTTTTLDSVRQLVFDACDFNERSIDAGLQLEAAMVYESLDDAMAREDRQWAAAAGTAEQAAALDPSYQPFAEAFNYWRLNARVNAADLVAGNIDPQLDAAIAAVTEVCATVGHPTGEEIAIPPEIHENTAERGRFNACDELIFGDDGSVYVAGQRYDYSDCERITLPALAAANHDDAYRDGVDLFFDEVGSPLCWGEECRDRYSFSPY
jgi:hypothetical protein